MRVPGDPDLTRPSERGGGGTEGVEEEVTAGTNTLQETGHLLEEFHVLVSWHRRVPTRRDRRVSGAEKFRTFTVIEPVPLQ